MDTPLFRPEAVAAFNAFAEALSGAPEIRRLTAVIDSHHQLAAKCRSLLYNGGAGPNASQLQRVDAMLRTIAGLPPT
jgi:1,6-anhydro-N-acetylmuramate kinase